MPKARKSKGREVDDDDASSSSSSVTEGLKAALPFLVVAKVAFPVFIAGLCALSWQSSSMDLTHPEREPEQGGTEEGASSFGPAITVKPEWLRQGLKFNSTNLLQIDTLNFNETVTGTNETLMIAFYDPNSLSFMYLAPVLDQLADQLAVRRDRGEALGFLGASDVTVDSYLGTREAPVVTSSWQESRKKDDATGYRFNKPRFYALVLIIYQMGERRDEYKGVVSVEAILEYLQRMKAPRNGTQLGTTSQLKSFLAGPGPFVIGCGLSNGTLEQAAFGSTAFDLHGTFAFGTAALSTCGDVNGGFEQDGSAIAWSRGNGAGLQGNWRLAPPAAAANAALLQAWLRKQRVQPLEEVTPDNSHVYLDSGKPLVLLLAHPKKKKSFEKQIQLFETLDEEPGMQLFHFVWADCDMFGSQFEVTSCPTVVFVNSATLDFKTRLLQLFSKPTKEKAEKPWTAANASVSERLTAWLWNCSGSYGYPANASEALNHLAQLEGKEQANATNDTNVTSNSSDQRGDGEEEEELELDNASTASNATANQSFDAVLAALETFLEGKMENASTARLFQDLMNFMYYMVDVKEGWKLKYPDLYAKFDFSKLSEVQAIHPHFAMLVETEEDLKALLKNEASLERLRGRIEKRSDFLEGLQNQTNREFHKNVVDGLRMVMRLIRDAFQFLHEHASNGKMGVSEGKILPVERRSAASLSVEEFLERYAKPSRPVIITGLEVAGDEPWTLDYFKEKCNTTVSLRKKNPTAKSWGRLTHAGKMRLPEFIDNFAKNETLRSWYLHDWSLPRSCPGAIGNAPYRGFTVPKYFAGDYFQRAAFNGYKHTWPSLFIGSSDTESQMHIDGGGTNFWLHLLSGRKEWRFYSRQELLNVYKDPLGSHFHLDVFAPDFDRFPLARYADMYSGIQEAGELMFIPGGNPHGVRNLEDIHGVSMNYVDLSNIWIYLLTMVQEENWNSFELFTDASFPHGLRSEQTELRFGAWKSTRWSNLTYDLI